MAPSFENKGGPWAPDHGPVKDQPSNFYRKVIQACDELADLHTNKFTFDSPEWHVEITRHTRSYKNEVS